MAQHQVSRCHDDKPPKLPNHRHLVVQIPSRRNPNPVFHVHPLTSFARAGFFVTVKKATPVTAFTEMWNMTNR